MNDDALNRGRIYKFLSNFYFLLLFLGFSGIDRGNAVSVFPLGREMEVVTGQGGLCVTHRLPSQSYKSPPILKMRNSN